MSQYGILHPGFFTGHTGREIARVGGKDAQLLALYLTANPDATMIGLYPVEIGIVKERIRTLSVRAIEQALFALGVVEFADYDLTTQYVWVREMAKFRLSLNVRPLDIKDHRVKHVQKLYRECRPNPFLAGFFERYAAELHLVDRREYTGEHRPVTPPKGSARAKEAPSKPVTEAVTVTEAVPSSEVHTPDQDPRVSRAADSQAVEISQTPPPRAALGDVRMHLLAACHSLIEDPAYRIAHGPAMGQIDEGEIVERLKCLAARELNASWDCSAEIAAIYRACVATREKRMARRLA